MTLAHGALGITSDLNIIADNITIDAVGTDRALYMRTLNYRTDLEGCFVVIGDLESQLTPHRYDDEYCVDVTIDGSTITVKGSKGTLTRTIHQKMTVEKKDNEIIVTRPDDTNESKALHGLTRSLIHNMVVGANENFKKELEINGIGYRAELQGKNLNLKVGYSHDVTMTPPEGITIEVPAPNKIVISGADKQKVGQFAANVREVRPPEPYKGKGIKYVDEHIRRKEGKAGKGGK